jgi:hypothetical protein
VDKHEPAIQFVGESPQPQRDRHRETFEFGHQRQIGTALHDSQEKLRQKESRDLYPGAQYVYQIYMNVYLHNIMNDMSVCSISSFDNDDDEHHRSVYAVSRPV